MLNEYFRRHLNAVAEVGADKPVPQYYTRKRFIPEREKVTGFSRSIPKNVIAEKSLRMCSTSIKGLPGRQQRQATLLQGECQAQESVPALCREMFQ